MFSAFKAAFPGQAVVPSGHLSEPAAGLEDEDGITEADAGRRKWRWCFHREEAAAGTGREGEQQRGRPQHEESKVGVGVERVQGEA